MAAATLIGRKIASATPAADPARITCEKVLHTAFARAAERQMHLPLRMPALAERQLSGPEIAEILPENALLLMLHGPQEGLGLMALSPAALAALIEMMTLGRVADHPPPARRPTRTDAAMVAGFTDMVLAECDSLFAATDDWRWTGGFRQGGHLPDPRPLGLMLEEPAYLVFRMSLAFGLPSGPEAEVRTGEVLLALPAAGHGRRPLSRPAGTGGDGPDMPGDAEWRRGLERAVLPAGAEVRAILARVTLALADLLRIEAGQSLALPAATLGAVRLEVADGGLICLGQLGQGQGHRALRLGPPPDEAPVSGPAGRGELLPAAEPSPPAARHPPPPRTPSEPPAGRDDAPAPAAALARAV
ncbi:MAG: FliM/FliN family flagellar motor switch protein [Proteobacteria bacterium]|nr:FliM/FliN family flagellar motor switch protein [Pseudomonadota bacterium]MBS0573609.1 FliM/FliN family flagellar motor switch protein [Pseudomonadota bacterium]